MTVRGRSPALRHVPRTHRIDLDWLFERIREDQSIDIRYVNTKLQIADFPTEGHFTSAQWISLCDMASVPDQIKGIRARRKSERNAPLPQEPEKVPQNKNQNKNTNKVRAERKLGVASITRSTAVREAKAKEDHYQLRGSKDEYRHIASKS